MWLDKLKAWYNFIISSYKRTSAVLIISAIILSIPFTLSLVGQQQDIRQRASEGETQTTRVAVSEQEYIWDYNVDPVPPEITNECWTNNTCDFLPESTHFYVPENQLKVVVPYVPYEETLTQKITQEINEPVYTEENTVSIDNGKYHCRKEPFICRVAGFWEFCAKPYIGWCPQGTPEDPTPTPIPCTPYPAECVDHEGNVSCQFFAYPPGGWCPVDETICTQDVRICPDGSYVGRTGANCEFKPCPNVPTPSTMFPTPTCTPRPSCLDAEPACLLPEPQNGWCPTNPTPTTIITYPTQGGTCVSKAKGDANCDAKTDTDDFNIWRDEFLNFRASGATPPPPFADFNFDGTVNTDDFNKWRDGFLGNL